MTPTAPTCRPRTRRTGSLARNALRWLWLAALLAGLALARAATAPAADGTTQRILALESLGRAHPVEAAQQLDALRAAHCALRAVEADFDRAWHEGQVTLLQTPGPKANDDALAA